MPPKVELRPEIATILVECPMPEHRALGAMPVAQLIDERPELAEKVILPLVETAGILEKSGMDFQEAADQAFKPVAVVDDNSGEVMRAETSSENPWQTLPEDADTKKKVA